jgi:hypothetical protein
LGDDVLEVLLALGRHAVESRKRRITFGGDLIFAKPAVNSFSMRETSARSVSGAVSHAALASAEKRVGGGEIVWLGFSFETPSSMPVSQLIASIPLGIFQASFLILLLLLLRQQRLHDSGPFQLRRRAGGNSRIRYCGRG